MFCPHPPNLACVTAIAILSYNYSCLFPHPDMNLSKNQRPIHSNVEEKDKLEYLGSAKLSESQLEALKAKLYGDSVSIMFKFQDLFSSLKHSLRKQGIPLKDVISEVCAIGAFLPVYNRTQQPVLREQLPKLQAAQHIEDIMLIINDYCSFFNYEIIEHLILNLGTEEDKQHLQKYINDFRLYAQRKVFECPSDLGALTEKGTIKLIVKLDSAYDDCTLNHLQIFKNKLCKILCLSNDGVLNLCQVEKGCIKLTFQLPNFVPSAVFPLSQIQMRALLDLKILWLLCGEYKFDKVRMHVNSESVVSKTSHTDLRVLLTGRP